MSCRETMNVESFLAKYDSFGERRTGSEGDKAAAVWLTDCAAATGALAQMIAVDFSRFIPSTAQLTIEGQVIEGLPLFDGGLTEAIEGAFGPLGSSADIGFVEMDPAAASLPNNEFARARRNSSHAGIVIALRTKPDGLAPLNAHDAETPFGPPVLQVAGRHAERLGGLAAAQVRAHLLVRGTHIPGWSHTIRAALSGTTPPVVLLTPRTSWWTSTAERAGGIYAWVKALDALAQSERLRSIVALATCGHELGHIGAHRAFAAEPDLVTEATIVLHLGANLGAAEDAGLMVRSNLPSLADLMAQRLVIAGYPSEAISAVTGGKANGEAHEVESRGGRYLSLIGRNPWFHAPEDRWPVSVDPVRTEAIATAVANLAVFMAR